MDLQQPHSAWSEQANFSLILGFGANGSIARGSTGIDGTNTLRGGWGVDLVDLLQAHQKVIWERPFLHELSPFGSANRSHSIPIRCLRIADVFKGNRIGRNASLDQEVAHPAHSGAGEAGGESLPLTV